MAKQKIKNKTIDKKKYIYKLNKYAFIIGFMFVAQ